jgi:hypothetical protein
LRGNSPSGLTVPVKVPLAWANNPVPPSMCAFCWVDAWNRQVRGSTVNVAPELVLTRCMVPTG